MASSVSQVLSPFLQLPATTTLLNPIHPTGIAGILSMYAMVDLIRHNRRQKRAWIDRELQRLFDAQQAFVRGDATQEQLHLLQQERAGDEMVEKAKRDKEKRKRESWWGKGMAMVGLGPKESLIEEDGARYDKVQSEPMKVLPGERLLEEERWVGGKDGGKTVTGAVVDTVEEQRRSGEKAAAQLPGAHAGALDRLAGNMTDAVKSLNQSVPKTGWLDWGKGKGQS
jgi:hypothetical protein